MNKEAEASKRIRATAEKDTEQTTNTQTQEIRTGACHRRAKKKRKLFKKDKVAELEKKISELEEEVAKQKNAYFKAYADTENLRKRLQSEAETTRKYRIQSFALEVLPVLDSMERALAVQSDDENIQKLCKGVCR